MNKPRCLCRHEEHEGTRCFWESPGGDLVGQYCTCEEYRPCPHPPEKKGVNSLGKPVCNGCATHFKSEDEYEEAKGARFQHLLDKCPTDVQLTFGHTENFNQEDFSFDKAVAVFSFSKKGFGFGEFSIIQTQEGCFIDTEHMSRETVKEFLCALVDGAVTDTDREPEKHLLYNRVAGRRCGPPCRICCPEEAGE